MTKLEGMPSARRKGLGCAKRFFIALYLQAILLLSIKAYTELLVLIRLIVLIVKTGDSVRREERDM